MLRFIIRRLLLMIPLLLGITFMVFAIVNLVPGSPVVQFEANPRMSQEDIERIRSNLGLDEPWPKRYVIWLGNLLRGDLGYSYINGVSVTGQILCGCRTPCSDGNGDLHRVGGGRPARRLRRNPP